MVEVLMTISIITISVLGFMSVAQKSIYLSRQSTHTVQAGFLLEEGAEATRIIRDNGWNNISSLTSGTNYYLSFNGATWTLSTTLNTVGIFTRRITISNINRDNSTSDISSTGTDDPSTKLITVNVSWLEGTTAVSKNLSFYISDIFS